MITKIEAKNKKDFEAKVKEYRAQGYNIITYAVKLIELEKGNTIVMITR